jgi:hypothetical protein
MPDIAPSGSGYTRESDPWNRAIPSREDFKLEVLGVATFIENWLFSNFNAESSCGLRSLDGAYVLIEESFWV